MERQFPLLDGLGQLTIREEGPRVLISAQLPEDSRGLYKAYLSGPSGRFLLGTLIPEHGTLRLHRTLSLDELKRRGLWPPAGAGAELAFAAESALEPLPAGWRRESNPARLLGEPLLRRCAGGLQEVLLRQRETGFSLAVPWQVGQAFPLPPLFCFAQLEKIQGRDYAVFSFSARGCPQIEGQ